MADETAPLTGLALLRAPFEAGDINKLPKPYKADSPKGNCKECGGYHGLPAVHLDYVGHAALTKRLLDADPEWSWEPLGISPDGLPAFDQNGGLWIRLTICGVSRLGYGDAQGKKGGNAVKEAIGDALRNAGMRFGAALDLWHKGDFADAQVERGSAQAAGPATPPAPEVDERTSHLWITTISAAETISQLQAAWEGAGKEGVTRDPKVIAAKDKRKQELTNA
jgi:hypothetical protein